MSRKKFPGMYCGSGNLQDVNKQIKQEILDADPLAAVKVREEADSGDLLSDLTALLNLHCLEGESDSPDFILAEYLIDSLDAYNAAAKKREAWYGRKLSCVEPKTSGAGE